MTDGRSLVRNSALNVIGLVVPLLLAVLAIPPLVRGFGAARFGLLTLAWAAIGYFNLFEFGLSRALTHAVARRLGSGEQRDIASVVWTTQVLLLVLGIFAASVLVLTTPMLVERALNLPQALRDEAVRVFGIVALALPLTLMSAGMRGLMEAHLDFGTVNAIRLPLSAVSYLGPLAVLPFSRSLVPAVVVLVAGRVAGWVVHVLICVHRYQYLRGPLTPRRELVGPLLRYGGWTTVSNVVSPLMVYMDRFVIGAVLSVAAVTNYVTPYEVVTKLAIIPGSILAAVFPTFSAVFTVDRERVGRLYDRAQRMVLLVIFPLVLPIIALAHEGLWEWMGSTLPPESATVLQWLALGTFINAMAHAPLTALQSAGRPDLAAKVHMAELPFYAAGLWWLLQTHGIIGVAIAWTLRASVDTVALLVVAHRRLKLSRVGIVVRARLFMLMLLTLVTAANLANVWTKVVFVLLAMVPFAWLAWRYLITEAERAAIGAWVRAARVFGRTEVA